MDRAFVDAHTSGFDDVSSWAHGLPWADLEQASGATRDRMRAFAALLAGSKRAVFVWSMGLTQHRHGADNVRALVNLALAAVCHLLPRPLSGSASACLVAGTLLVPGGFLLGGLFAHASDPGLGAVLIPPGALLVLVSVTTRLAPVQAVNSSAGGLPARPLH